MSREWQWWQAVEGGQWWVPQLLQLARTSLSSPTANQDGSSSEVQLGQHPSLGFIDIGVAHDALRSKMPPDGVGDDPVTTNVTWVPST